MMGLSVVKSVVEILVAQAMRMLGLRLQLHQVDDVDDADFQLRQVLAQDRHGSQRFKCRHVAAAGHHDVGLDALDRCWPTARCRCPARNA